MAYASSSSGTIKKVYERFTKRGTTESKPFLIATCVIINGREHYYCNDCKTAPFSRKGDAKRHYYGHLGKEYIPHQCHVPGCNRLFIQSGALKDHIKYTHDGETIHCAQCNDEFSNPSSYSRHQKRHNAAQKTSRQRSGRRKNMGSAPSDSAAISSRESTMDIISSVPSSTINYASPFLFSSSSRSTSTSTSSFDASSSGYSYTSFPAQGQVQKTAEQMQSERRLEVAKFLLEFSLSPSNW